MGQVDSESTRARLARVAGELRRALAEALGCGSWFAPTLDDCRIDLERITLTPEALHAAEPSALMARCELALRTWRRIALTSGDGARAWSRCQSCGVGVLVAVARPGRLAPFRGHRVEIPADFSIPTCDRCGAEALDAETAARLDRALMSSYYARQRR